jgi:hypothetical protein
VDWIENASFSGEEIVTMTDTDDVVDVGTYQQWRGYDWAST